MSVAVAAAAGVGAPFETGILPRLPEPPLDNFSSGEAALSDASLNDLAQGRWGARLVRRPLSWVPWEAPAGLAISRWRRAEQ